MKKKLTIQVPAEWLEREEIQELVKKGHIIIALPLDVDLFLGHKAHYFTEEMFKEKYLAVAIKGAAKQ